MSLLNDQDNVIRRESYDYTGANTNRKPSLREMPSFKNEVTHALNMTEDLQRIRDKLSMNREILHADPNSKPWLRSKSLSHSQTPNRGNSHFTIHTATPALVQEENELDDEVDRQPLRPPRSNSRGTSVSSEGF